MTHQDELQVPQWLESQAWFADSNASHHITSSTYKLLNKHSCEGPNNVIVDNYHILVVELVAFSKFRMRC